MMGCRASLTFHSTSTFFWLLALCNLLAYVIYYLTNTIIVAPRGIGVQGLYTTPGDSENGYK